MNNASRNWKTTVTGILAILGGIWNFISTKDVTSSGTAIIGGIGLIAAKDGNVTGTGA